MPFGRRTLLRGAINRAQQTSLQLRLLLERGTDHDARPGADVNAIMWADFDPTADRLGGQWTVDLADESAIRRAQILQKPTDAVRDQLSLPSTHPRISYTINIWHRLARARATDQHSIRPQSDDARHAWGGQLVWALLQPEPFGIDPHLSDPFNWPGLLGICSARAA